MGFESVRARSTEQGKAGLRPESPSGWKRMHTQVSPKSTPFQVRAAGNLTLGFKCPIPLAAVLCFARLFLGVQVSNRQIPTAQGKRSHPSLYPLIQLLPLESHAGLEAISQG